MILTSRMAVRSSIASSYFPYSNICLAVSMLTLRGSICSRCRWASSFDESLMSCTVKMWSLYIRCRFEKFTVHYCVWFISNSALLYTCTIVYFMSDSTLLYTSCQTVHYCILHVWQCTTVYFISDSALLYTSCQTVHYCILHVR